MLRKFKTVLLLTSSLFVLAAHADINSFNPFAWLLMKKDATEYASNIAATVQDRPECQTFKQEIMSYAKGSAYKGKDIMPIVAAKQKATAAGCAK